MCACACTVRSAKRIENSCSVHFSATHDDDDAAAAGRLIALLGRGGEGLIECPGYPLTDTAQSIRATDADASIPHTHTHVHIITY